MKPQFRYARYRNGWLYWAISLALTYVFMLASVEHAQAQTPLFTDSGQTLGTEASDTVALGDLDGDSDLDAFVVNQSTQPDRVWFNDGRGHLTDSGQELDEFISRDVALGDLDGDGDLDAVIANSEGSNTGWLNDGRGKFAMMSQTLGNSQSQAVALADLNGDGAFDIFFAGASAAIWLNNGAGSFSAGPAAPPTPAIADVALGDLNGDGAIDAMLAVAGGSKVWRNDGHGLFTDSGQSLGAWNNKSLALADLDGDRDLDAFITAGHFEIERPSQPNTVWRNDGTGSFTEAQQVALVIGRETNNGVEVALGDLDGDGDMDAYVPAYDRANDAVYINNSQGIFTPTLAIPAPYFSEGAALGDLDGNGNLDLFLVNSGNQPNQVMFNVNTTELQDTGQPVMNQGCGQDVALGDLDGNGTLDAVVANANIRGDSESDAFWLNNGQGNFTAGPSSLNQSSWGVALGDLDADGDLDAFFAQDSANRVWLNNGNGQLIDSGQVLTGSYGRDVALGDLDGDGDLDAFVASGDESFKNSRPNKVWLNNGQANFMDSGQALGNGYNFSVALGDLDGDGDLDAVVASELGGQYGGDFSQIWLNKGQGQFTKGGELNVFDGQGVALGDLDGDGDLDAFFANGFFGQPERIFFNDGSAHFTPSSQIISASSSTDAALGDLDGDGDLDVLVSNHDRNEVFLNDGTGHFSIIKLASGGNVYYRAVALGDLDRDGDLDAFTPRFQVESGSQHCRPYLSEGARIWRNEGGSPQRGHLAAVKPDRTADANFYSSPAILTNTLIPITYTLDITAAQSMHQVALYYSLNGGGQWFPASLQTQTTPPAPLTAGASSLVWNTFASGFFGNSDNVALRLVALPLPRLALPGSYQYTNAVAGPYQWPFIAATTFPFRVRGSQVRVVQQDTLAGPLSPQVPRAGASVYHLPGGQSGMAQPIRTGVDGPAYHTDSQGYLQGRGQLAIGDRLVALAPITASGSYTLYFMNATPTLTGLEPYTVTTPGVQTLVVSSDHPLLLFNLEVALEWDARKDTVFLEQLKFDLRRTAEFLFDATDGQAALGEIRLYHNKENWEGADIRIYASNALIPNADPGGIVRSEMSELIAANPFISATAPYSITYQPGAIRIGAVWNRFGEATGTLGEDWPRTLAHELGHYAFYLYDNYLGLQNGVVVPVTSCTNTLMTDQYREDFSEFRTADKWATECKQTISAQRSGRADWQTITRFYPWLKAPTGLPNPGPLTLPLAVTQLDTRFSTTPTLPLDVAVFDLVDVNGAAQLSGAHAQAVLYTSDGRLLDLGHPVVDNLEARGAHVGDRLCVYDLLEQRLGCETITANDNYLTMVRKPTWQPEIVVSPVSSRTVSVLVSNVAAGLSLQGKLYPENSPATSASGFVPWPGGVYSTTFQLSSGVLAGHIQVWVNEADSPANPRRESLTSYALGGSPGKRKPRASGNTKSLLAARQTKNETVTPAISPDGQVLIYGNVSFSDGEFYALQKVNRLPAPPLWTTVVGDGYRILKSNNAPALENTSILFRYRGQDVPAGEERFLSLYFWDEPGQQWQKLPTVLNPAVNEASAQAPGPGLYVLMSSLEIPLHRAGWNLVAYPVQETRPVTQALASITGTYSLIYGYVVTDTVDPWKLYASGAPAYVNDLENLNFGQGYWINVTQPITWLVKGPDESVVQTANDLPLPPATYYGAMLPNASFTPMAGLPVQALINGVVCGESITQESDGQIVYALHVVGDGSRGGACSGAGQAVQFTVAGVPAGSASWQNQSLQALTLGSAQQIYLPVVMK